MLSLLISSLYLTITFAANTVSLSNTHDLFQTTPTMRVRMPVGPFKLKERLFVAYSGTLWRVVDANNNEYNMKTLSAMSFVSPFAFQ